MIIELAERGLVPDVAIRAGIRRLLAARLRQQAPQALLSAAERAGSIRRLFAVGPIAEATDDARRQHDEAPTSLFERMLGPRLKYSCCLWDDGVADLAAAEEAMLELTAERAGITDGQRILDLGCGWGSFALWAAQRFPDADVVAASNSGTQHEFIVDEARHRGLKNIRHLVADVSAPEFDNLLSRVHPARGIDGDERVFDRIVSVEMFEHMRNVDRLLDRLHEWLAPGGQMLVHIFCHRQHFYRYQDDGHDDWIARHFFTGGAMPPLDLFEHVAGPFRLVKRWEIDPRHYASTCRAWLANIDAHAEELAFILAGAAGQAEARVQLQRWRIFLMACEELFAYDGGQQWIVSHHLLAPK
jgi:cyclopropane-fatty-acyl-phospholipid synthase